jgi:hypothetical protein
MATATFTTVIIDASRNNVHAIAQSSGANTGYRLAVVSAVANNTSSTANDHRIYSSTNYGSTWSLLENIYPSGATNLDKLIYADLQSSSVCMFRTVAISATGQYQSIGQTGNTRIWYSMDYGATWTLTNPGASTPWDYQTGYMFKYSTGDYPALTGNTGKTVWASTHFTRTSGKTTSILLNTNDGVFPNNGTDFTYAVANLPSGVTTNGPTGGNNKLMVVNKGKVYSYVNTTWSKNAAGSVFEITSKPSFSNNNYPSSDTTTFAGGVALSADASYCAIARYVTTGGLWVIRNADMSNNDFSYIGNYNVNVVAVSSTGQYMVAGPNTSGTFYFSSDYGNNWTTNTLTFTGKLYNLFITDDGKRIIGAGGIAEGSNIFSTTGYIEYIAPIPASEQRASGKTVTELITLSYTNSAIMGAGYSISELIAGGIPISDLITVYSGGDLLNNGILYNEIINYVNWLDLSATSNIFDKVYLKTFVDLSGDLLIRNDGALIVDGDASFNNITTVGSTNFANDTTLQSRLFIGSSVTSNGNLYVGGDLSVNGTFNGVFGNSVIPTSAIINYPIIDNITITGNVRISGDASFNGTTVDLSTNTILKVSGQVEFGDSTTMTSHDDNILSGSFAQGNVIFKNSDFKSVTCSGTVTTVAKVTTSDYRVKTNVTDLDQSYTVDNLVPIQYNNILSNTHEFGLIAHELQSVYPELVKGDKDGEEYQRVNYNGLIGVLVKEVQELKCRNEELCKQLE